MISFKHIKLLLLLGLAPLAASADNFVGTPVAAVDVNSNGAATYNLSVEIPDGGGFHPQIGLAYNSQSAGYGNAGYGFNITGISVITSGGRNIYYDGEVKGAEYLVNSSFYLDGKRLLLESGAEGYDGATYTLEGDPYTKITVHGSFPNTWFEVTKQDGTTFKYGNTSISPNSRLSLPFTKDGKARCAAWYISQAIDKYKNTIKYNYMIVNKMVLPTSITYGENTAKSRGISCSVKFDYSDIIYNSTTDNVRNFYIGGEKGNISKKLSTITSSITNSGNTYTYRKYTLDYNDKIDGCSKKYTRLTSITESNASGETYAPVKIDWNALPSSNDVTPKPVYVKTTPSYTNWKENVEKTFSSIDMNNDGISDIVRFAPGYIQYGNGKDGKTFLSISLSKVGSDGSITYTTLPTLDLNPNIDIEDFASNSMGINAADYNGDGYSDLLLSDYMAHPSGAYIQSYQVIYGGTTLNTSNPIDIGAKKYDYKPINTNFDMNCDSKDELLLLETVQQGGYYNIIIKINNGNDTWNTENTRITLKSKPKNIFIGDYNNDGLGDLIVLHEDGYKIFYNNGFSSSYASVFNNTNVKEVNKDSDSNCLRDYWRVKQGDFDGDGLIDFVYAKKGDSHLWIAHNNGNGLFSINQVNDIKLSEHPASQDNNKYSINVVDMDLDGLSDIVVCKAVYEYNGWWDDLWGNDYDYDNTRIIWLKSKGNTFSEIKNFTTSRAEDALEGCIFTGDFDGDGALELANYGGSLINSSTAFREDVIYTYKCGTNTSSLGKVSAITDALGVKTSITYSSATDPKVCKIGTLHAYPINSYAAPIPVVSQLSTLPKNINIYTVTKYQYGDMRVHCQGRGMLGFMSFTKKNQNTSVSENTKITDWDSNYKIPTRVISTITYPDGGEIKTTAYTHVKNLGSTKIGKIGKYYAYPDVNGVTDTYGNLTKTSYTYECDANKCILKSQSISDDGGKYIKSVSYEYDSKPVGKYGSMWLPKQVISRQKHADDSKTRTKYTTYEYNDWGNPTRIVNNAKTVDSLVTFYTYDSYYGLKRSEKTTGRSVKTIVKNYAHDSSGRFITRQWTSPSSSEYEYIEYNYNIYGNLTREQDKKDQNNILLTVHKYSAWNEEIETIYPDGKNGVTYTREWDTSVSNGCYSVTETPVIGPRKKTIYDSLGREIYSSTTGMGGVDISKSISYDGRGYVSSIVNNTGKLTITETFTYDGRGRKITDKLSSGASTAYKYGNRSLVTTAKADSGDRVTTTTYDAWGNVKSIIDPLDTYVEYIYDSNGQPASVTTNTNSGSSTTVELTYNAAGYRTKMVDPDAGTMTYKYAADGTILSQTDARGVTTNYSYDNLGRLKAKTYVDKSGHKTTQTNEYFTEGKDVNRLKSQTYDGFKRSFTYDKYGNVTSETRHVNHHLSGPTTYTTKWDYDQYGQMTKVSYPGTIAPLEFNYSYDKYGYIKEIKQGSQSVYSLKSYDGLTLETNTVAGVLSKTVDKDGYPYAYQLSVNSTVKDKLNFEYDKSTGNLLTRCWRNNGLTKFNELFKYDEKDRLLSVSNNVSKALMMSMSYADNGNILNKSDVGQYTYDSNGKPHAVTSVSNSSKNIGSNTVLTTFDTNGKIGSIQTDGAYLAYLYGPDDEKWMTVGWNPHQTCENDIEHVYFGNYERIIEDDVITEQYFLENGVILISKTVGTEDPRWDVYQAVTDNLGSVLVVYDEYKKEAFRAKYDAWGKQTVYTNKINFQYGYTGHEMLPDFGLIDMKGRLYDPTLGRFLSCDNYVQTPYDSQNFNRYSYCFNNPLKYTDPDGNVAWFVPVIAGAVIGGYVGASMESGTFNCFKWDSGAWKGAIAGAIVGATLGYGVSSAAGWTTVSTGANAGTLIKSAGTVSSIINSGTTNIMWSALSGDGWDGAWKAGLAGLATGAWSITGGFGMVKGFGNTYCGKLAGKLGYQMIGTTLESMGNNWSRGCNIFSKVVLGVGPVNLTIGKNQPLLSFMDNIENIFTNVGGLVYVLSTKGNIRWNMDNLTMMYHAKGKNGYGAFAIFGDPIHYEHETHHLWHSRAIGWKYFAQYALQGVNGMLSGLYDYPIGDFLWDSNAYEAMAYHGYWWDVPKYNW